MWTRATSLTSSPGATTQPTRQAIMRCSNDGAPTVTVRSRMPASAAGCRIGWPSNSTLSYPAPPVQQPQVPLLADRGNRLPLLVAGHPPRRERRVVQEDDTRALHERGRQRIQIQAPLPIADAQRDQPWDRADEPHAVEHARVGR